MSSTFKRGARLSAIGAAAALAAGGLMVAPAVAEEGAAQTATLDEIAAQAKSIDGVVKILQDGNGVITVTTESENGEGGFTAAAADTLSALDAKYSNVQVEQGEAFVAKSADEVVGGAGLVYPTSDGGAAVCSAGFSGWSPAGDAAVITAGHCADGAEGQVNLSVPSTDDAVGSEEPAYTPDVGAPLGAYGFYQYGGPGDSLGEDGNETSTDIAVIDNINPDLTLLPEVTDWTTQAEDDLAASTVSVTGIGQAAIGEEIQRSGRTTGFETGLVQEKGWASVSGHWVYGFSATQIGDDTFVLGGDSGGAVMQGNTAVGIVSGGNTDGSFLWYADLQAALAVTGGYTVALDIAEPSITTATAEMGTQFEGQGPANSEITIAGDIEAVVPTSDSGYFSFPAPAKAGSFDITMTAKQGYNVSETVKATVKTTKIQVDAPAITSPTNELRTTEAVTQVTGTGMPGAEVALQGDAAGTATVAEDGTWSVDVELGFGEYTVGATQTKAGVESEARWVSFQVVPGAPSIVTPENGGTYEEGMLPAVTGESPLNGATVTLDIEGPEAASATIEAVRAAGGAEVVGGVWMVELEEQLAPGNYTIEATQSIDGVTSDPASVSFEVVAAGSGGGDEGEPEPPIEEPDEGDDLAPTGADTASTVLPLAGGAAVILLAGATLLMVRRVTRA